MLRNRKPRQTPRSNSSRVPVNTYYGGRKPTAGGSPFESRPEAPKKGRFRVIGVDTLVLLLLLILAASSFLVGSRAKIIVNDTTFHSVSDYQTVADAKLKAFINRNKVTFDQASIANSLKSHYPEIDSTTVELPVLGRQPVVNIKVAKPAIFVKSTSTSWLVSSSGVAVGPQTQYHHLESLVSVDDQSGLDVKPGLRILSQDDVRFIQTITKQMKIYSIPVKELVLPNASRQLNLYVSNGSYYVKFYMGGNPNLQAAQMIAVLQQLKNSPPSQYLDVRVDGKAFYK